MEYNINSPYYVRKAYGGLSPCVEGNTKYGLRPFKGSVLPNCVGMAVAEFNRMIFGDENPQIKYLGNRNAVDFTVFPGQQGLDWGYEPRVGACMVWDYGEGHVGVIKEIVKYDPNDPVNDEVITAESGWSYRAQPIIREIHRKRGKDGRWGYSHDLLMMIYPPGSQPPTPDEPIYYKVVRGDNLTKIAKKYNTTVQQLVIWNNLKNANLILVGQVLIVGKKSPEPPEPPKEYYTVVRGDNLTKIAQRFGTTVAQLVKWNNIPNKNLIYPGQVLRVK